MKRLVTGALALTLLGSAAYAQPDDHHDHDHGGSPPAPHGAAPAPPAHPGPAPGPHGGPPPRGNPGGPRQPGANPGGPRQPGPQGFNPGGPRQPGPGFAGRPGGPTPYAGRVFRAPQRFRGPAYYYPRGFGYRAWAFGDFLPPAFFINDYTLYNYWMYGLQPPPPGFEWVRVGPDALLVRLGDGYVLDVAQGLFW